MKRHPGMTAGAFSALLLWVLAATSADAACLDYGDYLHYATRYAIASGDIEAVAPRGDLLLVANWTSPGRIHVVDISDPYQPAPLGTLPMPFDADDPVEVKWFSDTVGVAISDNDYMLVFDCSDPAAPRLLSMIRGLHLPLLSLAVAPPLVLVTEVGGAAIFDLSDPASPSLVGRILAGGGTGSDVSVEGDYAYLSIWNGVSGVWDISTPSAPVRVGNLGSDTSANSVAVSGGRALLCHGSYSFAVFDVSNPGNPVLLEDVPVARRAYFEPLGNGLVLSTGIRIYDLKLPLASACVGSIAGSAWPMYADGFLYSCFYGGIEIDAAPQLASPALVAHLDTGNPARSFAIDADRLFLANGTAGLRVVDVRDPANPVITAGLAGIGDAADVDVENGLACVASDSGLVVVDVAADPTILARVRLGAAQSVRVAGGFAYVTCGAGGLGIVDLQNPAQPVVTGGLTLVGQSFTIVRVAGPTAYLGGTGTYGFATVDIGDPAAPHLISGSSIACEAFTLTDRLACVAGGGIVRILDVTDPANLLAVGQLASPGIAHHAFADGNVLYVSTERNGLVLLDISRPQAPAMRGHFAGDVQGRHAETRNGSLYYADGSGLYVLPVQCPIPGVPTAVGGAPDRPGAALGLSVAPNPFNPRTVVSFTLDRDQPVRVTVHDLAGRVVARLAEGRLPAGRHELVWDGRDRRGAAVASGIFVVHVKAADLAASARVAVVR